MTSPSARFRRRTAAIAIASIAGVTAAGLPAASARPAKHAPPVTAHSRYLALGDSISFGYRESNAIPAPHYQKPKKIIGFPEDVAKNLGLRLTNAACPGETTVSFIDAAKQSNGCENTYDPDNGLVPGGYRTAYPLHINYKSAKQSQLQYAEAFLKKYPKTSLVSLMIGANDGFLCLKKSTDNCANEFPDLQAKVTKHVTKILKGIRNKARYGGQIVIVTYYSIDYGNTIDNVQAQGLNQALLDAGRPFHIEIADGFGQFQADAAQAGGNTCAAQLLTALSGPDEGTCGVHPSLAGQALLAQALEQAVKK